MITCTNHQNHAATELCAKCQRPFCSECLCAIDEKYYCKECAAELQHKSTDIIDTVEPKKKKKMLLSNKLMLIMFIVVAIMISTIIPQITNEVIKTKSVTCEHEWTDATCTELSKCKICGKTTGKLKEHVYEDYLCINCGAAEYKFVFSNFYTTNEGYGYHKFNATIENYDKIEYRFVQVKLRLYKDGKVIDTDWTYAVGSEGLASREKKNFSIYKHCSESFDDWDLVIFDYSC